MRIMATNIVSDNLVYRYVLGLPISVKGFVTMSADGCQNVFINANYGYSETRKVELHELEHINNNDLFNDMSIYDIEK